MIVSEAGNHVHPRMWFACIMIGHYTAIDLEVDASRSTAHNLKDVQCEKGHVAHPKAYAQRRCLGLETMRSTSKTVGDKTDFRFFSSVIYSACKSQPVT